MRYVGYSLFTVSLLVGAVGLVFLSQATMGTGLIAGACLLAVYTRILQASIYHHEHMDAIEPTRDGRE